MWPSKPCRELKIRYILTTRAASTLHRKYFKCAVFRVCVFCMYVFECAACANIPYLTSFPPFAPYTFLPARQEVGRQGKARQGKTGDKTGPARGPNVLVLFVEDQLTIQSLLVPWICVAIYLPTWPAFLGAAHIDCTVSPDNHQPQSKNPSPISPHHPSSLSPSRFLHILSSVHICQTAAHVPRFRLPELFRPSRKLSSTTLE